jgi:hypothetical protein
MITIEMMETDASTLIEDLLMAKDAVQSLGRLMRIERGLVAAERIHTFITQLRARLDTADTLEPVEDASYGDRIGIKVGDQVAWRHNAKPAGVVEAVGRDAGTGLPCIRTDQVGWKLASLFWRFG